MKITKKKAVVAIGVLGVTMTAGAAFAYWSTDGSGTGTAIAGTSAPVTISQTEPISGLRPDGPASAIKFKINNPSSGPQFVNYMNISVDSVVGGTDTNFPACSASDFFIVQAGTTTDPGKIAQNVAPGDTLFETSGAAISMVNKVTNQDNCKGAQVNLKFTAY